MVSIITPTYNCEAFIDETIRSVLHQTFTDWEMIIVDDCSSDKTLHIIRHYAHEDSRIRCFSNETNCGAAYSRNRALREAKGEWIAFLDGDDVWLPTKLEEQLDFMQTNNYAFTYHEYEEIDEFSQYLGVHVGGKKVVGKFGMYSCCWPGCLSVMYNRNVVGLVQIADIKKNNDSAMWFKVIAKTPCYLLPQTLACYRRRKNSITPPDIKSKIAWHYRLFRQAEGFSPVAAAFWTAANICGNSYKKLFYVKKHSMI
jgi:glycosyltransferase involved in cell wall biosynthesis